MASRVYLVEDGFAIRGIAPPSLARQPADVKLMFYGWALEAALRQKDRDLAQGLDKDGKPLRRISAATRKHRKSEMTPSGKGDPSAPPLEPGRKLSRVRSLLTGRAEVDHIELWWKFDPFTGDSFARVLEHQAEHGRDVFGLSPAALKRVMGQSWEKYKRWEAGKPVAMPVPIGYAQAQPIVMVGAPIGPYATMGIGRATVPAGQFSGGMRVEDWIRHLRQPAPVTIPGRPKGPYNRLLGHIWGGQAPPAAPPKPKPPAPPKPPKPPAWQWGEPIDVDRTIAERIEASPARKWTEKIRKANEVYETAKEAARTLNDQIDRLTEECGKLKVSQLSEAEKARYLAEFNRLTAEAKVARQARDKAKGNAAKRTAAILKLPPSASKFGWSHDTSGLDTPESKAAFAGARNFLDDFVALHAASTKSDEGIRWNTIPAGNEQRAHCLDVLAKVYLRRDETVDIAIHEWGHQIEFSVPGVRQATQEFLEHRIGNEPLRKLKDVMGPQYRDDEEGREDDFGKAFGEKRWYVGKHYHGASEIVSMGLEKLYNDPGGFARDDPEYCTFILGILDGSLRKP